MNFTAAQFAVALGKTPQAFRKMLRNVRPAGVKIVAGNETAAWAVEQLPAPIREWLAIEAVRKNCTGENMIRRIETLLSMPREQWQPPIPLNKIFDKDIQTATKLRETLKPFLIQQHDPNLSASELESRGVEDYKRVFGNRITTRYWRELLKRTIRRDNGFEEWNRLEIYLPDRLKKKGAPADIVSEALAADFSELQNYINACSNPHAPNKSECNAIWTLAFEKLSALVRAGVSEKIAARRVRQFLFARASFLAASRDALLKGFNRKLDALKNADGDVKALRDGREENGNRVEIPNVDIDRLRASAAFKNGGRINAAWREEYPHLSESTRRRYPGSQNCPAKIYELLNRKIVDALADRHQGKRNLRRKCGSIKRNWDDVPSMHLWVVDDMTANLELAVTNRDGSTSLITPQVIAVMDSASRKWVGWAISDDKAPTAELVCGAVLDAIKTHGVPKKLGLENGFVFGKSLNINGKEDEQGRTMVAGLAQYGCVISHFDKMNPTSKAELEKSFDLVQRRMERHPGYTGRLQLLNAPEDFKREQRLIRSGKVDARQFRYTFEEGIIVISKLIHEYNSAAQHGHLKGLSPNEAFVTLKNQYDPPTEFTPELEWLLANERYRVTVEISGVKFTHYGRKIEVRGGQLVNLHGQELWALVDRRDDSMVTFMDLNFANPFTLEVCKKVSPDELRLAPGSHALATERAKIREHERAVNENYNRLLNQFGNPRQDLLAAIRNQPPDIATGARRRVIIDPQMAESAEQMQQQREGIRAEKKNKESRNRLAKNLMQHNGIAVPEHAAESLQPDEARFLANFLDGKETG